MRVILSFTAANEHWHRLLLFLVEHLHPIADINTSLWLVPEQVRISKNHPYESNRLWLWIWSAAHMFRFVLPDGCCWLSVGTTASWETEEIVLLNTNTAQFQHVLNTDQIKRTHHNTYIYKQNKWNVLSHLIKEETTSIKQWTKTCSHKVVFWLVFDQINHVIQPL